MSIITRKGDGGYTALANGEQVAKYDVRIMALGALDELSAQLGIVKSHLRNSEASRTPEQEPVPIMEIDDLQQTLIAVMGMVAGYYNKSAEPSALPSSTRLLESKITAFEHILPPQKGFTLYGMTQTSALLHNARAVARRAESWLVKAAENQVSLRDACIYLNRLSDFLYLWACHTDFEQEVTAAVRAAIEQQQPREPKALPGVLTLAVTKALMEQIEKKAADMRLPVVIAICNAQGNPIAVHAMDDALLIGYDAALGKAFTAAALRMHTAALNPLVQPGQMFYTLESLGNGKIVAIAGGAPLLDGDGRLLGGLGISGGSNTQDAALADYGVSALARLTAQGR